MAATVRWYNDERTIVLFELAAPWTWDEYHTSIKKIDDLIDEVNHQVDVISDLTNIGRLPPDTLLQMGTASFAQPNSNLRYSIIVGMLPGIKTIIDLGARVFDRFSNERNTYFVKTMDEALEFLDQFEAH